MHKIHRNWLVFLHTDLRVMHVFLVLHSSSRVKSSRCVEIYTASIMTCSTSLSSTGYLQRQTPMYPLTLTHWAVTQQSPLPGICGMILNHFMPQCEGPLFILWYNLFERTGISLWHSPVCLRDNWPFYGAVCLRDNDHFMALSERTGIRLWRGPVWENSDTLWRSLFEGPLIARGWVAT